MDTAAAEAASNPNNGVEVPKPKIVVIMGPTGSGKSRLAIDLAAHFPIEIINADSMQVYRGLDVLTNKVPVSDQKGVTHHLLGTIDATVEFTSKDFRDAAVPIINDILSHNHLPVIVGGTNFYIQALASTFLLEDSVEDMDTCCLNDPSASAPEYGSDILNGNDSYSYNHLKVLDPVAANRIHPNDHRKVKQYLHLIARSGILPSKLFQGKMAENWGRLDNSRYNCCFICVDASLAVLDEYVGQRVDQMINAGLLDEVYDIYTQNADYTRGLRQAIGVREFEDFLTAYSLDIQSDTYAADRSASVNNSSNPALKESMSQLLSSSDNPFKCLLEEAIDKVKANTRRLVRRQKRRIRRLETLFGWSIHHVDSTDSLHGQSNDTWFAQVVEPSTQVIRSFLDGNAMSVAPDPDDTVCTIEPKVNQSDLWTQYVCEERRDKI
ncbi:hypothetical protein Ancab_011218 [Ancistrocladus abbreviatus]